MVLYSSTKFGIIKLWINIPFLRRLDSGFWQTSKQIYGKFQRRENVFGKFQGLLRFSRKMVFYSLSKFCIFYPCANIQSLRTFVLSLWGTSKQIYKKLWYEEKFFGKLQVLLCFTRKMVLCSLTKFCIFLAFYIYSITQEILFRILTEPKTSL